MSKNELLLREQPNVTGGRMTKSQTIQATRLLRDDELNLVSGGFRLEIGNLPCD